MKSEHFFVFDTNALISAFLLSRSVSRIALNRAITLGSLALSDTVFQEFIDVLFRKKFDRYFFDEEERLRILDKTESNAVFFSPTEIINICRDPKDNMFLELAIAADASCIISGDNHLLELHPFRDIPILTAAEFIERY